MGNLSYIIAIENKQDFNSEFIAEMIKKNFTDLSVIVESEDDPYYSLIKIEKDGRLVFDLWPERCDLLEEENTPEVLKNLIPEENCFAASHCIHFDMNLLQTKIMTLIVKHFKGYWLDEGIHPEFIKHDDAFLEKYMK